MNEATRQPINDAGHIPGTPAPDPLREAILTLGGDIEWANHTSNHIGQLIWLMWEWDQVLCAHAVLEILGQGADFLTETYLTEAFGDATPALRPLVDKILAIQ